jgi:hypothetical protein
MEMTQANVKSAVDAAFALFYWNEYIERAIQRLQGMVAAYLRTKKGLTENEIEQVLRYLDAEGQNHTLIFNHHTIQSGFYAEFLEVLSHGPGDDIRLTI